jgi:nucleoside-diphosphate-sugar epimerase
MYILLATGLVVLLVALYLRHVNNAMKRIPPEISTLSSPRLTEEDIITTYKRICDSPIDITPHLPPSLKRRYVVVGGSGMIGGFIVLHLIARGQPPESIRIVDLRKPDRRDLNRGKATKVQYVQADIASAASVTAAFEHPWPANVASLPLTVFHVAAAIRPGERARIVMPRCFTPNVTGTENVLSAAKKSGADIFVATSSASVALRPANFWVPPWRSYPKNFVQIYPEPDQDQNIRGHEQYFSNYAHSKAVAEGLVLKAHGKSFKTGCIRPGCAVYGNHQDLTLGPWIARGQIET